MHLPYSTKLSRKSQDFYFLVGIYLNVCLHTWQENNCLVVMRYSRVVTKNKLSGWVMAVENLWAPLSGCIHIDCGICFNLQSSAAEKFYHLVHKIWSPAKVKWGGMPPRILYVIHVSWHVSITGNYNRELNAVRLDACLFITDIWNFVMVDFLPVAAIHLCNSLNDFSHFHNLTSVSCVFYLLSSSQIGK